MPAKYGVNERVIYRQPDSEWSQLAVAISVKWKLIL